LNDAVPEPTIAGDIKRYLRTGDADIDARAWPGDIFDRGKRQHADLRDALVREVRRLAKGRSHVAVPANVGVDFTRAKVEPMVRGLFTHAEQDTVLATFEKSVVYITSETIEPILLNHMWDRSAWDLANMYLLSVGAKLLGKKAARTSVRRRGPQAPPACNENIRTLVAVLVGTGMRLDEALDSIWTDVDFQHRLIHVHRGRRGAPKSEPSSRADLRLGAARDETREGREHVALARREARQVRRTARRAARGACSVRSKRPWSMSCGRRGSGCTAFDTPSPDCSSRPAVTHSSGPRSSATLACDLYSRGHGPTICERSRSALPVC
jgi:integrase